jgi:hypothetical protein
MLKAKHQELTAKVFNFLDKPIMNETPPSVELHNTKCSCGLDLSKNNDLACILITKFYNQNLWPRAKLSHYSVSLMNDSMREFEYGSSARKSPDHKDTLLHGHYIKEQMKEFVKSSEEDFEHFGQEVVAARDRRHVKR